MRAQLCLVMPRYPTTELYENHISEIPPALWATGGLSAASNQLLFSTPSPGSSDPARLEVSRANIVFSKPYKTLSESLLKYSANRAIRFFLYTYSRWVSCKVGRTDKLCFCFVLTIPADGAQMQPMLLDPFLFSVIESRPLDFFKPFL